MIQLGEKGIHVSSDLGGMREEFASGHVIRIPRLLSDEIVGRLQARLAAGRWVEKIHPGIKKELVLDDPKATHVLHFLTNNAEFLDAIRRITGYPDIANFRGRIYRMVPGLEHNDSWHDDINEKEQRLVGMSINLGSPAYTGGLFEIRRCDSESPLQSIANTVAGDALLFNISRDLRHRVTSLGAGEPKTAFAGWFKAWGGAYLPTIRQ